MLAFIAVCAAIWLAQELLACRRGRIVPLATEATPPGEVYSIPKAVIGLVIIVAYGGLPPIIAFPIATAIFIALWCIFVGVLHPTAVPLTYLMRTDAPPLPLQQPTPIPLHPALTT